MFWCTSTAVCAFTILNPVSSTRFVFSILGPLAGLPEVALPAGMVLFCLVHLNISIVIFSTRNAKRVLFVKDH